MNSHKPKAFQLLFALRQGFCDRFHSFPAAGNFPFRQNIPVPGSISLPALSSAPGSIPLPALSSTPADFSAAGRLPPPGGGCQMQPDIVMIAFQIQNIPAPHQQFLSVAHKINFLCQGYFEMRDFSDGSPQILLQGKTPDRMEKRHPQRPENLFHIPGDKDNRQIGKLLPDPLRQQKGFLPLFPAQNQIGTSFQLLPFFFRKQQNRGIQPALGKKQFQNLRNLFPQLLWAA